MPQTIFITGASGGLGAGAALALAAAGHRVVATAETWSQVRALRDAAAARGTDLEVRKLDLRDAIDLARAASVAASADVLVLNAAVQESGAVLDIPLARVRESFEINLFGHLDLVQRVVPAMVARGAGRVVWVSSIAGLQSIPFLGAYSATKHAIEAVAGAMRAELQDLGVTVATIAPGVFGTGFNDTGAESMRQWHDPATAVVPVPDMTDALAGQDDPQEMVDAMVAAIPDPDAPYRVMRPLATAAEVRRAQAAVWDS